MKDKLTIQQMQKLQDELNNYTYTCDCGHRVVIPYNVDKQICQWCHRYVFKSKQDEFKYRLEEQRRKEVK